MTFAPHNATPPPAFQQAFLGAGNALPQFRLNVAAPPASPAVLPQYPLPLAAVAIGAQNAYSPRHVEPGFVAQEAVAAIQVNPPSPAAEPAVAVVVAERTPDVVSHDTSTTIAPVSRNLAREDIDKPVLQALSDMGFVEPVVGKVLIEFYGNTSFGRILPDIDVCDSLIRWLSSYTFLIAAGRPSRAQGTGVSPVTSHVQLPGTHCQVLPQRHVCLARRQSLH